MEKGAAVTCDGRLFHRWAAATEKHFVAKRRQTSTSNVQRCWWSRMQLSSGFSDCWSMYLG